MKSRVQKDGSASTGATFKPVKLRTDVAKVEDQLIDIEHIIFQALINEGTYLKVLNSRRQPLTFNEKELREAAHAEVAQSTGMATEAEKGSKKRKNLDNDEKLKQSRDRNREHAKYTRLRKKAYVGKLKSLLDEMKAITEVEETERRTLGEKINQTQNARKDAVRLFLTYRGRNCRDKNLWAALLDERFTLTLPITPFRSFPRCEILGSSRVVRGVDAVMSDTCSLALMAESIGLGSGMWRHAIKRNAACKIEYRVEPADIVAAGELVMCRYTMHLLNCDAVGASGSCVQHGMLQCRFDGQSDRIAAAEFIFDVMGFMQQLQMCWGISPENSIVPNTLDGAMQPSKEPQAILSATAPFPVLHVNDAWRQLLGTHSSSESEDTALLQAVQVYAFQRELIYKLASEGANGVPGSAIFLSHGQPPTTPGQEGEPRGPQLGTPVVFYIKLLPLTSDSERTSHFLVSLVELPLTPEESRAATERAAVLSQHPRFLVRPGAGTLSAAGGSRQSSSSHSSRSSSRGPPLHPADSYGHPMPPVPQMQGNNPAPTPPHHALYPTQHAPYFPNYPGGVLTYPLVYAPLVGNTRTYPAFPPQHTSAAGMAAPGEVYLSQEALRNNPNATRALAPKRSNNAK